MMMQNLNSAEASTRAHHEDGVHRHTDGLSLPILNLQDDSPYLNPSAHSPQFSHSSERGNPTIESAVYTEATLPELELNDQATKPFTSSPNHREVCFAKPADREVCFATPADREVCFAKRADLAEDSSSPPEGPALQQKLTIATFNVFAGSPYWLPWNVCGKSHPSLYRCERLSGQIAEMLRIGADVFCLQEVHSDLVLAQLKQGLGSEYSCLCSLDSQHVLWRLRYSVELCVLMCLAMAIWFVRKGLIHMTHSPHYTNPLALVLFCAAVGVVQYIKSGTTWQFLSCRATGLAIFYRHDKLRCEGWTRRCFAQQSGDFLNRFRPRGWIAATFAVGNTRVTVMSTHANSFSETQRDVTDQLPERSDYRKQQLEQLFKEASASDDTTIVCGDFNTMLQFDEIPSEKLGFANAWANEQAECITWDCHNPWTDGFQQGKGVDACLDYIFFKGNGDKHTSEITELVRCEVIMNKPALSDHYGLNATIQM